MLTLKWTRQTLRKTQQVKNTRRIDFENPKIHVSLGLQLSDLALGRAMR